LGGGASESMDGTIQLSQPYEDNFDRNQHPNKYPSGTLNKTIGSLKRVAENKGVLWDSYFPSISTQSNDREHDIPIENSENMKRNT
jgi:hypothetical protein